jgi:hypothetical protein
MEDGSTPQVYAVLDAARDDAIYAKLTATDVEYLSLFRGEKAKELATVAPYLVKLEQGNPFTRWLLEKGWGNSWGIWVESAATLKELKRHFQSILQVVDEDGNSLFFRYYDPRVLRVYLPTCNEKELVVFFGPVGTFFYEDEEASIVINRLAEDKQLWKEKEQIT